MLLWLFAVYTVFLSWNSALAAPWNEFNECSNCWVEDQNINLTWAKLGNISLRVHHFELLNMLIWTTSIWVETPVLLVFVPLFRILAQRNTSVLLQNAQVLCWVSFAEWYEINLPKLVKNSNTWPVSLITSQCFEDSAEKYHCSFSYERREKWIKEKLMQIIQVLHHSAPTLEFSEWKQKTVLKK